VAEPGEVTLRSVAVAAFLPAGLQATGVGALAAALALSARSLGASVSQAGLVVALLGLGQVLADVPAGAIAERLGERRAMVISLLASAVGSALCLGAGWWWHNLAVLVVGVVVIGATNAVFGLARQSFLTDVVPHHLRARALSTLGGMFRVGMVLGPFIAAPAIALGGPTAAFGVHLMACLVTIVVLLRVPDPRGVEPVAVPVPGGLRTVVRDNARALRTLGLTGVLIGAVRASRQVVIPLWADHLGLDAATVSLVFGLSGLVDALVFYPSGKVMDTRGRATVAVPSMAVLGVAHLLLPLTHSTAALVGVALMMGLGNGMGSGVVMTLAADVAPRQGRAQFLGVWRIFHDAGSMSGPLLLAGVVTVVPLPAAIAVMGGCAIGTAGLLRRWIPAGPSTAADVDRDR